ncbi:unnamed protein product, partial [marine sediment metagenome]
EKDRNFIFPPTNRSTFTYPTEEYIKVENHIKLAK